MKKHSRATWLEWLLTEVGCEGRSACTYHEKTTSSGSLLLAQGFIELKPASNLLVSRRMTLNFWPLGWQVLRD